MSTRPIEEARDPDLRASWTALKRAAQRARDVAIQTNTSIVVSRAGVVKHISADELIRERALHNSSVDKA